MLKTIEEVVSYRLRELRGNRTQSEMAELLDLPLRSYQSLEYGAIPRPETRMIISSKLNIPETYLYLDPDLTKPTDEQIVARIAERFSGKSALTAAPPTELLAALDEGQLASVMNLINSFRINNSRKLLDPVKSKKHKA